MIAYKRRSKAQWQQLIEAQQSSGLSQTAFCLQEGLSIGTFSNWKRKLKEGDSLIAPTVTVVTDDGHRWRISPHLISKAKDAKPEQKFIYYNENQTE